MYAAEVVARELVVSSCDAAPVFDSAPHALNAVSCPIGPLVVRDRVGARGRRGDDGFGALLGQAVAQVVGVISAVGDQSSDRSRAIEKPSCDSDVVDIARRQDEDAGPAFAVRERVKLARLAAAGFAERLLEGPPFPPAAERCALMCVLSIAARP